MSIIIPQSTIDRLQHVPPFDCLPPLSRQLLFSTAVLHALSAGDRVIDDNTLPASAALYVVLSGRVRLVDTEQNMTIRHLSGNEVFGHFALLRNLPPPYRAELTQSGELLEIQRDTLFVLLARHPFFAAWFQADLRRFERELGAFDDAVGSRFLFGQRLGELEHAPALLCEPTLSIRAIAQRMSERDSDYVIMIREGYPVGLVSDGDLRNQVVAKGVSTSNPVSTIMTTDLLTIRARASVFDGMMAMEHRNRRHLVLLDDTGALHGVVSDTDLARVLLTSPSALRRRIDQAESESDLRKLRQAADQMIVTLYRRGVRAEDLLQINTRFNDDLTVRILALVCRQLKDPPADLLWCWLSLGSEGRGEMGLRTDQDNAIIYSAGSADEADAWLGFLASEANRLLDCAGIAFCDGGIMACNPAMRLDLNGWRDALDEWMSDPDDVRLLWVAAMIDSRPLFGEGALCSSLRKTLLESLGQRRNFLRVLAREALVPELPLKRFPNLRLKGNRSSQGPSLHLKRHGTHLITHAARLLCLGADSLDQTGTGARLAWLVENDPPLSDIAGEAIIAYGVLSDLRLSWHVEQISLGEPLDDIMPLSKFGETRKRLLISAYQTVDDIRLRIARQFNLDG